jgi:hypothetical protein
MKKPWHRANPSLLAKLEEDLRGPYPDLRVVVENECVHIRGSFPIFSDGLALDRYQIDVSIPNDFPDAVPTLREIGGRVPWDSNRHVNPNGQACGEACPVVPEEWLLNPKRDSILSFLNGPVRDFFLAQSLVEAGDPWPFSWRAHGFDGLYQAYGELLGTTDRACIRRYLEYLSKERIKGHWECPCGSGSKLRNCHLNEVRALQSKIPTNVAKQALQRLGQGQA